MQIKITMHATAHQSGKNIFKSSNTKVWQKPGATRNSHAAGHRPNWVNYPPKCCLYVLVKAKIFYDPAIPVPGEHLRTVGLK